MYIQLKHAFSELVLRTAEACFQGPGEVRVIGSALAFLVAYVYETRTGESMNRRAIEGVAKRLMGEAGFPEPLQWNVPQEFLVFDRDHGLVSLRPEYRPHLAYLKRQASRLWELFSTCASHFPQKPHPVQLGLLLFNQGLFFECHEYLEGIWRVAPEKDRKFYHGLIQIAAAFYHYEKGNPRGARALLQRGLEKLDTCGPIHLGVELKHLREELAPWLEAFSCSRYPVQAHFPKLKWSPEHTGSS